MYISKMQDFKMGENNMADSLNKICYASPSLVENIQFDETETSQKWILLYEKSNNVR